MNFHWSLNDGKSPQISWTLHSFLADLNKTVVWIFSSQPSISNSFSPHSKLLGIVPSARIIIGITVTFMFPRFFSSLARSKYLSPFSLSFNFTLWSVGRYRICTKQNLSKRMKQKILWDFEIQTDDLIQTRKPDQMLVAKKRGAKARQILWPC